MKKFVQSLFLSILLFLPFLTYKSSPLQAGSCGGVIFDGTATPTTVQSTVVVSSPGTVSITVEVTYPDVVGGALGNADFDVEIKQDGVVVNFTRVTVEFGGAPSGGTWAGSGTTLISLPEGDYTFEIKEVGIVRFTDGDLCVNTLTVGTPIDCSATTVCQPGVAAGCEFDEYCTLDNGSYECHHHSIVGTYCTLTCGDPSTNCKTGSLSGCPELTDVCVNNTCLDPIEDEDEITNSCQPNPNSCIPNEEDCIPGDLLQSCCQNANSNAVYECIIDPNSINTGFIEYMCGDKNLVVGPPAPIASPTPPALCADGVSIDSGIGCIPVNETNRFTIALLSWGLGIAGSMSVLVIGFAAFTIKTSEGDPRKLRMGQDMLVGAIAALLLMLFSTFLLRLVGFSILGIAQFGT